MKTLLLDWGIGGLSVYRELKALAPALDCVYISDSGFTPYGKVSSVDLRARLQILISGARELWGIERAVIACNAASTVLDATEWGVPTSGVIEPGLRLVHESGFRCIGVIGGVRTIESRIFSSRLKNFEVREEVAQPLSALIERGVLAGGELECALNRILRPLKGVEALLLACTHYPAIATEIQKILPEVHLLDPARAAAEDVFSSLNIEGSVGSSSFFTSGDPAQMESAGKKAFGVDFRAQNIPEILRA